jgi:hypothetical protein
MIDLKDKIVRDVLRRMRGHRREKMFWVFRKDEAGTWEFRRGKKVTVGNIPSFVGDRLLDSGKVEWRDQDKENGAHLILC